MAFYGYKGDAGERHWTPYNTNSFDQISVLPPESPMAYSAYEFNEPGVTDYTPYSYFDSYIPIQSVQNYYTCNLSEPRLIQCDPPPSYAVSSFYCQTNSIICDSNIEFNEPEFDGCDPISYFYCQKNNIISDSNIEFDEPDFDECDPTPYSGGYDQIQTYGKPLPPSDEICYPPSSLQPKPNGKLLDGSIPAANGGKNKQPIKPDGGINPPSSPQPKPDGKLLDSSIPASYGEKNEKPTKPDGESKPTATKEHDEEKIAEGTDSGRIGSPKKPLMEEGCHGDVDEHPSFDYAGTGGYGYEWNRQVPYIPYGSGLESLDLCESIFGYWPCLAKPERQEKVKCNCSQVGNDEDSRHDPWQSAADYLFGTPFVYSEVQNGGAGSCPHHNSYAQRNC